MQDPNNIKPRKVGDGLLRKDVTGEVLNELDHQIKLGTNDIIFGSKPKGPDLTRLTEKV